MRLTYNLNAAAFKAAAVTMAVTTLAFAAPASAHDTGYVHQHQNSNSDQLIGAGLGAIAGGVLGSQLAGNGARTEGSVLGAVIGGVAGAAIAGDNNNRGYSNQNGHYSGGTYNPQTGYYQGGQQRGYYQQPRTNYGYSTTYQQPVQQQYGYHQPIYQQPVYPQTTYTTTYHQSAPVYRPAYNPYYRAPRSGISINIGTGGYYGNRGYSRRHVRSQPRRRHNQRRHNQRRRGH